jgi:UDP-N-acetylmuramoyl-tripeptide--D-alanyl-D-alanine ligase
VPLTVFSAGSDADALVVEMGMRGLGQIERLCAIARPHFGLVTNVGVSHIELLGTQEAVTSAKGELVSCIPPDGAVFLNGDDAFSEPLSQIAEAPVTLYGLSEACAIRAENIELDDESRPSFDLVSPQGTVRVHVAAPGRHNVYNALAAAAVGLRLAVDLEKVAEGIAAAPASSMRMESFTAASGVVVVNDAYNANPSSMAAAVEALADMKVTGKRVAVLGDMAELGSLTELAHFRIGEQVARLDIDLLVTVGDRARRIADGARATGMDRDLIRPCASVDEAVEVLDDVLVSGDAVLVKASRVMGLEAVVEGIVAPRAH